VIDVATDISQPRIVPRRFILWGYILCDVHSKRELKIGMDPRDTGRLYREVTRCGECEPGKNVAQLAGLTVARALVDDVGLTEEIVKGLEVALSLYREKHPEVRPSSPP